MMYICSYCNGFIRDDGKGLADSRISHGLCESCEKLTDAERDKLAEARTKEREQKKQCLECWHTESVCKEEGVCLGFMRKDTDKPVNPPLKPILLGGFAFGVIFFILYCTIAGG